MGKDVLNNFLILLSFLFFSKYEKEASRPSKIIAGKWFKNT